MKKMSEKLRTIVENKPVPRRFDRPRPESFSLLPAEREIVRALVVRAEDAGRTVTRSEIVRAAVRLLDEQNDSAFLKLLDSVPKVRSGRPPIREF